MSPNPRQNRSPVEGASQAINATNPATMDLRAAAGLYQDGADDETGALLQMMYEQSAEQDDLSRFRQTP